MESENVHDFDVTMGTFRHPRYEIIATGAVHDGEAAVRAYFKESRTAFPDQRNELISLRHADDARDRRVLAARHPPAARCSASRRRAASSAAG